MTHDAKDTDESTPKGGGRDERTTNLWRRERLGRGESIDFDAGLGRTGEIEVISDCECTVCRVDQPKLLWIDGSESEYRGGAVCLDCLRAVLAGPEACNHKWIDARNEVVTSGEICTKCGSIRAQETPSKPDDPTALSSSPTGEKTMQLSGLTAPIVKDDCSFAHFLWSCATQLSEHDPDLDIVHVHVDAQTEYYEKRIADDGEELAKIRGMTDAEFDDHQDQEFATATAEWDRAEMSRNLLLSKIRAMKTKVEAWQPPTPEHDGLKQLMLRQLHTSHEKNERRSGLPNPVAVSRLDHVSRLENAIARNRFHIEDRISSAADQQKWLDELRESVPIPDTKRIVEQVTQSGQPDT